MYKLYGKFVFTLLQKLAMNTNFHHVYSNGVNVLFFDESDYIFFNNRLAVATHESGVELLGFTIMSTHFHAVVLTWVQDALEKFVTFLRKTYAIYFHNKYGHSLSPMEFEISYSDNEKYSNPDRRKNRVLYVLKNPVKHQTCESVFAYEFGSARYMLLDKVLTIKEKEAQFKSCKKVGEVSARYRQRTLGGDNIPDDWLCTDNGQILPTSFVSIDRCFKEYFENHISSFLFHMNRRMDDDTNELVGDDHLLLKSSRYNDLQVCRMITDFVSEHNVRSLFFLGDSDRNFLINKLRHMFITDDQIQRCLWLPKDAKH